MHELLIHDNFWIYIVASVILFVIAVGVAPQLMSFLDKVADARKNRRDDASEKKINRRYKTF